MCRRQWTMKRNKKRRKQWQHRWQWSSRVVFRFLLLIFKLFSIWPDKTIIATLLFFNVPTQMKECIAIHCSFQMSIELSGKLRSLRKSRTRFTNLYFISRIKREFSRKRSFTGNALCCLKKNIRFYIRNWTIKTRNLCKYSTIKVNLFLLLSVALKRSRSRSRPLATRRLFHSFCATLYNVMPLISSRRP